VSRRSGVNHILIMVIVPRVGMIFLLEFSSLASKLWGAATDGARDFITEVA
jgi:hypothetical protein